MPKKYDQDLREHAVRMVLDKGALPPDLGHGV